MRQVPRPVGLPAAYTPGASSNSALTLRIMSQTLSASPSSAYTPSRVPANACPASARTSACTGGRSTRQPFTTGPAAVRRAGEAAQMAGPQTAVGAAAQRQHVLAAQPAPWVGCRDRAGRVGDLRPGRAAIPRQLDAVGGAHIHGV